MLKIGESEEREYLEHVKECLCFAQWIAEAAVGKDEEMKGALLWAVFDKVCTPIYYFLQDRGQGASQLPTEKQLDFARKLEIQNPETFSKEVKIIKRR
jgi:hypothetical protein